MSFSIDNIGPFGLGDHQIILTVSDGELSSSCNATVTMEDQTAPILGNSLLFVDCLDDDEGDRYQVDLTVSDNCDPTPAVISVIGLPQLYNSQAIFRKKNKKKLKFQFSQNKVTVDAPGNGGAETWWNQILAQGGIEVTLGQQIDLTDPQTNSTVQFKFHNDGTLKEVSAYAFDLISTATDEYGNQTVATFAAQMECTNSGGALSAPESQGLPENIEPGQEELILGENSSEQLASALTAFPNPFSDRTTIRFQLTQPEQVMVEIYDLKGQRVKQLLNATMYEGSHVLTWYGNGDAGQALDSGIYLIRLRAGEVVLTRKLSLVR